MQPTTSHIKRLDRLLAACFLLIAGTLPMMAGITSPAPARAWQTEPVTHYHAQYYAFGIEGPQYDVFDPAIPAGIYSATSAENLFLGLVDNAPVGGIRPEMATGWTVSESGRIWTFTLRDDVPWVRWNPAAGKGEIVRPVTAQDFEYGLKRICDPHLGNYYSSLAAGIILGCDALLQMPPDQVTEADYDQVQVHALDDTTLEVELQMPASYFLSLLTLPGFRAIPREILEQHGDDWTRPGTFVTNGPFVLDELSPGQRWVYQRNPYLPGDLRGPGNVERVVVTVVEDHAAALALYQNNLIDLHQGSTGDLRPVLQDAAYAGEVHQVPEFSVVYLGFSHDKPPFDDVRVRRAFSAAVDRRKLVEEVSPGIGVPMIHFTPPGMFGAPSINEIGVGFDPDYARAQLALAGYPDCKNLPKITTLTFMYAKALEFLVTSAVEVLGCDPDRFIIEEQDFEMFIGSIDPALPPEERPHVFFLFWAPDYPDAHNWVGDVLSCTADNSFNRPCSEIDDLIDQAAVETDLATRAALYANIEERFFGPEGEHPIIPLFMYTSYMLVKPWAQVPTLSGPEGGAATHYDWITIDQAAQLAARGE
jgi:oligopeptide transport system substrate-binding protein